MLDLHHLPGSDLEEKKIFTLRAHPITLLPLLLAAVLVCALPVIGYVGFRLFRPDIFETSANLALYAMAASLFFLFGWLFLYQAFTEYWLDVFIVTDKRVLDIDQTGLFGRTVSELRLYRIQDVTAEVKGFIHSIFDYGAVYVQTAGEKERFEFHNVPHPNHLAKVILEMSEEDRKEHLEEAVEDFGMPDGPMHETVAKKMEP